MATLSGSRPPAKTPRPKLRPDDGRLVRGRRSRARIREAARELFAERGFDGATLRAIAERAGMGASSIYRHVRSKEELLVAELADLQEEAWTRFRTEDDRSAPTRDRIQRFLDLQHEVLVESPDLTMIALRATTHTAARVARRVLALQDRTIGLLAEILQRGRMSGELSREADLLAAARTIFHLTQGSRTAWANGLQSPEACREAIDGGVAVLFSGLESPTAGH
ncbi:MAG: helix-turn-helix transcriptional regulator [Deltaproteobacteria bacterium]|nr:helix-turn-helix transcriptional regulator [Deltaproteobacteria bacterium]MBW2447700.1 helix-turn-helix transcriptional regulator [Deltaproteobacteria bacterium]